jgi:hypothetical protein
MYKFLPIIYFKGDVQNSVHEDCLFKIGLGNQIDVDAQLYASLVDSDIFITYFRPIFSLFSPIFSVYFMIILLVKIGNKYFDK